MASQRRRSWRGSQPLLRVATLPPPLRHLAKGLRHGVAYDMAVGAELTMRL